MANAAGEEASPPADFGLGKRLRRPSVRLHQPYYDYSGKVEQQGKVSSKKPRIVKNVDPKSNDNRKGKGVETEDLNFDDNVAIGNWKSVSRGGDFKRERVRFSNSKNWGPEKSRLTVDLEIEKPPSTSNGESEEDEQIEEEEKEEEEKDLDDKLGGRNRSLIEMGGKVRMWLNELGLGKYGRLFEVHGVDDQVLPLLTLEDLKEMGIVEVGVRRKMFCSIQKLNTGVL